ncbi:MAG: hypothetical protein WC994_09175 [Brumimicrobium sp.]
MRALLKKEYRFGVILIFAFGLFLFTIDQTSEQVVTYFTGKGFQYVEPAFLKLNYLVLLIVALAGLATLSRSNKKSDVEKGKTFSRFVNLSVFSFFPGWIIHLYYVIQVMNTGESFVELEQKWWIYYASDITLVFGFALAGILILRPAIHSEKFFK